MPVGPGTATEELSERINLYIPASTRQRVQRVASIRKTSEGATARWLVEHALDWFEDLSREEKVSA